MRSLLITNDFPPFWAGEAEYYYNIWKYLPAREIIVLAPKIPGHAEFDKTQPYTVYRGRGLLFPGFFGRLIKPFVYFFYTLKILKKHPDIRLIHCGNILATFLTGWFVKNFYKIPYFVYIFAEDLRGYGKIPPLRRFFVNFLNRAKKIIVISEFTRQRFVKKGVREELFRVLYPGIDPEIFYPRESEAIKKKYNLQNKKIILSVGRLVRRKGFDVVIKAMPAVLKVVPEAALLICGDGELRNALDNLVRQLKLENHVVFAGYVPHAQLPAYYNACDLFILDSREYRSVDAEGFGIVFLEAGACGKPAIGGRSGGVPEAVIDGETGFLVDPLDQRDAAQKIIRIFQDEVLAKQLGENARRRIHGQLLWKHAAMKLEGFVREG